MTGPGGDWIMPIPSELDHLFDVDLTSTPPADGDALVFDDGSGLWVPGEVSGGGNASYAETVGDTSETSFDIAHSLDTTDVHVEVIELASGDALVHGTGYTWLVLDADTVRVVFSSAPDTDDARIVVLGAGAASASGAAGLLASTEYAPESATSVTTSSSTWADADATNLSVTFTVPASGSVVVNLSAFVSFPSMPGSGTRSYEWGLREGSSMVSGSIRAALRMDPDVYDPNFGIPSSYHQLFTGLTPSAELTWKWAHRVDTATDTEARMLVDNGNNRWGTGLMEVWAA